MNHLQVKQTPLGLVPAHWDVVPLGDLATVERGKFAHRPRNDPRLYGGPYPFVQTGDVAACAGRIANFRQTLNEIGLSESRLFPAGTIVITIAANIGDTGIAMFPVAFPDSLVGIRVGPRMYNEFLELVLRSRKGELEATAPQNAQKNINLETLRPLLIQVPPLREQRKIAAILSSVDEAIEATHAVIAQLQVVKKAMIAELLTRGLPGRHTRFKQTDIGEVPEEWAVIRLGEVCERMFVGIAQAATHAYVTSGGVPIIRTTNVRPNRLRVDDILRINDTFAEDMRSKRLRAGDVLSARTGYPGTSVVVPTEFDGAQCFTLLVSRPGPRLLAGFLCHLMNSEVGERIVQQGQAGGAQQNLNVGIFEKAVIGLPSVEEQGTICHSVDAVYEREWSEEGYLAALRALKASLMSVLLTGEVRVRLDEEAA